MERKAHTQRPKHQRRSTRISEGGTTVFVRLRVDRELYEYARHWANLHAGAMPRGTAEDQLEGYLHTALLGGMLDDDWMAPPEILALYPKPEPTEKDDDDDGIPF